jgi:hypothetical protein
MATGDASGTWGTVTNTNLELIGEALGFGTEAITTNADTHTSTVADGASDGSGSNNGARAMYLKYTGTLDSACTITIAPNDMKRMQFIENGTSGSQNIIISQGSGANVTIPPGDTKAVYLDGAGSGAAVVDAFASLNVVDLKVEDDLTVTDDASVGGDLLVSGEVQTANIGFTDGDNAMTIADGGAVTFPQASVFTSGFSASAGVTITNADNTDQLVLKSTDADANVGPVLRLNRDSGSPADSDLLGSIIWQGDNDAGEATEVGQMFVQFDDVSNGSEDGSIYLKTRTAGSLISRIGMFSSTTVINEDGADIDFRVESDTNANMLVVDAGNNRVGIGAVGGSGNGLAVTNTDGGSALVVHRDFSGSNVGSATTSATLDFTMSDSATSHQTLAKISPQAIAGTGDALGGIMRLFTSNSSGTTTERMRIDSSGNVTVGKTSNSHSTVGVGLEYSGGGNFVVNGGTTLILNRLSSAGTILDFRKDSSSIGIIGTNGELGIGDEDVGIYFSPSTDSIIPCNPASTFVNRGSAIDLGYSSVPFKDIYLSGGAFIGGTGSANKLEDYEEGTWTPAFASTSATFAYAVQGGTYTKVGRLIMCSFRLALSGAPGGTTTNGVVVSGLPFNSGTLEQTYHGGMFGGYMNINLDSTGVLAYQTASGAATVELKVVGDNIGEQGVQANDLNSNAEIRGQIIYHTA